MHRHDEAAVFRIQRPDPKLLPYYLLTSFLLGPLFLAALIPLYFRYHTLRYRFDEEGISMAWGILFRREIHLTYSRIQDIHLVANVLERWLGLARIQIQTASGSSKAEMTLEGLLDFELVRDFLYARMRGLRDGGDPRAHAAESAATRAAIAGAATGASSVAASGWADSAVASIGAGDELARVLAEVAAELRGVRLALERSCEERDQARGASPAQARGIEGDASE